MNIISEYKELKKRRVNLKASMSTVKTAERRKELENILVDIERKLCEMSDNITVRDYLSKQKKLCELKKKQGLYNYYKKDTVQLSSAIRELESELVLLEIGKIPIQQEPEHTEIVKESHSNTYYSINLAWSGNNRDVIDAVCGFLNKSSYAELQSDQSDQREEHMITWKYFYESNEEKIISKDLYVCASHLLEVLKTVFPSNAELFGKIQNY